MKAPDMEIQEVDDSAYPQAVEDIAKGSSDDEAERHSLETSRRSNQQNPQQSRHGKGNTRKQQRAIRECLSEEAKGNALVEAEAQIEVW